jgi:polysaccharide biosynthesis protein VpsI
MKIALVGPSLNLKGGVVSVMKGLSAYLDRSGVRVELIRTTAGKSVFSNVFIFFQALLLTICACLPGGCDVIHLHVASRGSFLRKSVLAIVCLVLRKPYILHLHGGGFHDFYENQINTVGRMYVRFIFRHARFAVALSSVWKDWMDSNISLVNSEVIFNGVAAIADLDSSRRRRDVVLFLGRVCEEKGVSELIAVARKIKETHPDVEFEIGGEGDLDFYQRASGDLENVRFLGWLDDDERARVLESATLFCLPSWNEGVPMSILEAMAASLPIVSTCVGGIPETVESGVTGLLVPPRDVDALAAAISTILTDQELAVQMGERGRERQVNAFSQDCMGCNCLRLYKRCVGPT